MKKQKTLQSYYGPLVGSAELNFSSAVAGSVNDFMLTYRAGKHGIDEAGAIKVLFRIASDIGAAQFSDPDKKNFVSVASSNKNSEFILFNSMSQKAGKQGVRPWSRGFSLQVSGDDLKEGDEVFINFTNFTMQTFTENDFEFHICVDPFATGKFVEIENQPKTTIVPAEPERLLILLPSSTTPGKSLNIFAKIEDKYGNVCTNFNGTVSISSRNYSLVINKDILLQAGAGVADAKILYEGIYTVSGSLEKIMAVSNPCICTTKNVPRYLWADLQGQSNETVGTNSAEDYFKFARGYGRLDIVSHQANDFQITNDFWTEINRLTKSYDRADHFVALPGYEWSGNSSLGGDHNVIFRREGHQIHRSSHALVNDLTDVETDAMTIVDLCDKIDNDNTVLLAHAGGRHANLEKHTSSTSPDLIEIHSDWGTFEWLLKDAFDKKMHIGISANSDGHKGTPGASYPGSMHFGSQGGLTCVRAESLDRDCVFDALKLRHTYGTTGARILLDVECVNNNGETLAVAGDIVAIPNNQAHLVVRTATTTPLERVEIYQKNKIIKTFYAENRLAEPGKLVKILYSGASEKGRSRSLKWEGMINMLNNSIEEIEKINFYSEFDEVKATDSKIFISGTTTGGCQGIIARLRNDVGSLKVAFNDREFVLDVEDITQELKTYDFGALDMKLEIYETLKSSDSCQGEYEVLLDEISGVETPYFVKIIQRDGHMAWSSPIYVSRI
ncbi:hypothetical protein COV03_04205 [Candidatus Uhrbacteria bacterium CG10_big_fil_rev_8_21_14_0_10_41_26]|nr:MAG: hypothetical protein COZ45_03340 [Candidatus Uhrbacteria bacterium CG_4_10_14_3_um_filter_41_21]PIZ55483.1 MAG: hypothetical protein COY24_00070 [Candidatus Uhrbacteria bacterium CG_4_10_14_0_2_um_filter_41_21]PJB84687.1 MAG: hypothetical protein CO086_02240 [Candidatus Uhrbacteria bacterium CG_4_9_14_0_8_um_filter_41_16]PJE74692.1 MAG: hypothetical protein COV03_04205 [Candidatus Uhrbacteria bacterium CG10_big_fil_rev_8_21_14_0_10_41_26]